MGELRLGLPVSGAKKTSIFDEARPAGRKHKGLDYAASKGTLVKASESGVVMFAYPNIPGYGSLIIINHTPNAKECRCIYTLYAHLDNLYVKSGDYVEKYEVIGAVGSTGYSTSNPGNDPDHLHFEVIDTTWKATVGQMIQKDGAAREYRKDPMDYLSKTTTVDGTLPDIVEQAIMDRVEFVPDIDLKRKDLFRMQAWLDGKYLGYVNKYTLSIEANIDYDLKEELGKIWRKPLRVPERVPIELEYKIELQ